MKKITLVCFLLSLTWFSFAQVGINTITPEASSALDIESTTGGILIPRLTEFQRDAIALPATGLMIYQTDKNPGFYFYGGTSWTKINGAAGPRGPQGVFGGASFEYKYGGVGPLLSDVDNGLVRFLDSDTQNLAMQLQFSELDINGSSVFSFIEMLSQTQSSTKGVVRLVNKLDSSKNLQFKITDIDFTNATGSSTPGYFIFDVENVASSSSNPFSDFASYTPVVMTYSISGSDGLQGPQGEQGIQGPIGLTGLTGPSGQDGANGIDGVDGAQGQTGATGPTGPQGEQGIQGAQGPIGLTGATGPAGQDGAVGATGAQGPQGEQGIQGEQGPEGPQGIQGDQGIQGPIGATGPQGIQGEQGIQGAQGPIGLTGPSGQDGANGINGEDGAVGATGAQGIQGDQGAQGIQGPIGLTGATGQQGPQGIVGPDGQSAYQIWLSRGNTGTEADFIASLTGPTGLQGAQGEQGIQGPIGLTGPAGQDGADGADGAQGPIGPAGAQGPTGQDGVDGVDGETGPAGEAGPAGATGVAGPSGPPGSQGAPGNDGVDGTDGVDGIQGTTGEIGPEGNGVSSTVQNDDGTITFNYTDGTSFTTDNLMGSTGTLASKVLQGYDTSMPSWYVATQPVTSSSNPTTTQILTNGYSGFYKLIYQFTSGNNNSNNGIGHFFIKDPSGNVLHSNIGTYPTSNYNNNNTGQNDYRAAFEIDSSWDYIQLEGYCEPCDGQFLVRPMDVQLALFNDVVGQTGPAGAQGETGPAGATGVAGPTGPPGSQGAPGNDGIDGTDGDVGLSAYEIWINAGNTGSEADFLASLVGPEGNTGSSLTGFKTITTFFDQTISVAPQSTVTGDIPNINTSHVIIKFIPNHINYHSIGLGIKCYDNNNVLLDLYVDELKARRDRRYSLSEDYTKVETFHYNTTYMTSNYEVVTGSNGGGSASGLGDFKIWSNGIIDRIEYTISHSNQNVNQPWGTRSPKLTVYKLQ